MIEKLIKYSIVVPCYNESKNIPLLLEKLGTIIKREDIEIILVDNGSTDNSAEVLVEEIAKYSFARTVKVEVNQGYGFGILTGLENAIGEYLGWTHADLQTDPNDILKAIKIIEHCNDTNVYVKGDRKGRKLFDQFFTTGMSFYESIYLGAKLWDINAQPNIFHRNFYESWENPPHDFSLDLYTLYIAKEKNVSVKRFAVRFPERIHGESSWNTGLKAKYKFIKRTLDFSTNLKKGLK